MIQFFPLRPVFCSPSANFVIFLFFLLSISRWLIFSVAYPFLTDFPWLLLYALLTWVLHLHSHPFIFHKYILYCSYMFCYLSVSGLCVTLCRLFSSFLFFSFSLLQFLSSVCLCFAASVLPLCFSSILHPFLSLSFSFILVFFWLWTPFFPSFLSTFYPSEVSLLLHAFFCTLFLPPFVFFLSLASLLQSCVSEPMVVCAVHPPASHSAPSFLRQYAGHLGRTALRREPGGGLERDRAYLSLHRTGSLGTHTHTHAHTLWQRVACTQKKTYS